MVVTLPDPSAEQLSRYVVHEHLGSGVTCDAFRVTSVDDGKAYVLKQMSLLSMNDAQKQRAKQEIDVMSTVDHPNVVRFRESFAGASAVNIVMEYCEFGTLEQLLSRLRREGGNNGSGGRLADQVLLEWMAELLCALAHIHAKGIVHRDVKTSNIFVTAKNHLKLGDFGVCTLLSDRVTATTAMVGTPLYFAPEVCQYLPYDERCDVWSLGVVLYEMCTLRRPFVANSLPQLMERIVHDDVPPFAPGLDAQFEGVVRAMLCKQPQQRPTAQELIDTYLNVPASHPSHPSVLPALGRYKQSLHGPQLQLVVTSSSTSSLSHEQVQVHAHARPATHVDDDVDDDDGHDATTALMTTTTAAADALAGGDEWLQTCESLDLLAKLLQTSTLAAPRATTAPPHTAGRHTDDSSKKSSNNDNGDDDNVDDALAAAARAATKVESASQTTEARAPPRQQAPTPASTRRRHGHKRNAASSQLRNRHPDNNNNNNKSNNVVAGDATTAHVCRRAAAAAVAHSDAAATTATRASPTTPVTRTRAHATRPRRQARTLRHTDNKNNNSNTSCDDSATTSRRPTRRRTTATSTAASATSTAAATNAMAAVVATPSTVAASDDCAQRALLMASVRRALRHQRRRLFGASDDNNDNDGDDSGSDDAMCGGGSASVPSTSPPRLIVVLDARAARERQLQQ